MRTVVTRDGDMLDALVWREVGRIAGALESVLDANPHIARLPPALPAGVAIVLPDAALAPPPRPVFRLWE
jgi:phage tail protein X